MTLRGVARGTTFVVPGIPAIFKRVDTLDMYRITEKYPDADLEILLSSLYDNVTYDCPVVVLATNPDTDTADTQEQTEDRPKRVKVTRVKR